MPIRIVVLLAALSMLVPAACGVGESPPPVADPARQQQPEPVEQEDATATTNLPTSALKLALLLDFSGPLAEFGPEMKRGFDLAITQINAAGGVWGMPVEAAVGDDGTNPGIAVEEARRLVEVEGVHAMVGPMTSAMTLAVVESVTADAGIPLISPVATSSQLTLADDNDFLFRVSLVDRVEGVYLARLTQERGFDNVALLYRDDAFGQGLARAFAEHWTGTLVAVGVDPAGSSFISELQQSTRSGAEALVLVAFPAESALILREALEQGYYDQFVFGSPGRDTALTDAVGAAALANMYGTLIAPAPENDSARAWLEAFTTEYGAPPARSYVKETYDATIALALAAQAAGSSDGAAIRDQLRRIGSAPGQTVIAEAGSIAAGLQAAAGGADIDYEGAAGTLDWDANGDITRGYIGIWRFNEAGEIEQVDVFAYTAD